MASDETDPQRPVPADPRNAVMDRLRDPSRLCALTDGVFAIVLTILVLAVAVPAKLDTASLDHVLEDLTPTLVAWVISFFIVGMYWTAHRDLFARLRYANRDIVWINLMFLLPVCLIPFGSTLIGEYPNEPIALHIYGIIVIIAALMRLALYAYAVRRPMLLWEQEFDREAWLGFSIAAVPRLPYIVAMVAAGWSTEISRILFLTAPATYFLVITVLRDNPATRAEADEFD